MYWNDFGFSIRSYLENILKGSCNPALGTVEQIAGRLRVDPVLLLLSPVGACQICHFARLCNSALCIQSIQKPQCQGREER